MIPAAENAPDAVMIIGDSGNAAVFGPIGHGGAERMIVYPVMLWMLAMSGYLMGTAGERSGEARLELLEYRR